MTAKQYPGSLGASFSDLEKWRKQVEPVIAELNAYLAKHPGATVQNDPKMAEFKRRADALNASAPHDALGEAIRSGLKDTVGAIQKIPVLGPVISAATAPLSMAVSLSRGERIDHALLDAAKSQLGAIKAVAPYAAAVVSFIPGIGTGVAAALAAGIALAEGKSIDQALEDAIKAAIPGGALAVTGFELAKKVASGQNVGKAVLEAARSQLPPVAQQAFDVGLAVVSGKQLQSAITSAIVNLAPGEMKQILDVGSKAVQSVPGLSTLAKSLPTDIARQGLQLASGVLARAGVNESQIRAIRSKLTGDALNGFDTALKSQAAHLPWVDSIIANSAQIGPTSAQLDLQKLAQLSPEQRQQLVDMQALAKLSPDQQKELVAFKKTQDDLARIAQLSSTEQKQLTDLQALSKLSPEEQKKLVDYANAQKNTPAPMSTVVKRPATPAAPATGSRTTPAPGAPLYGPYPSGMSGGALRGVSTRYGEYPTGHGTLSGPPPSCSALGPPISVMHPGMRRAGTSAVNGSGGRPRMVHGPDGIDYLFMIENGVLTARECLH